MTVIDQQQGVAIAVVVTRALEQRTDIDQSLRLAILNYIAEWNVAIGTADERSAQARTRMFARDLSEDERLILANAVLMGRALINRAQEVLASA